MTTPSGVWNQSQSRVPPVSCGAPPPVALPARGKASPERAIAALLPDAGLPIVRHHGSS